MSEGSQRPPYTSLAILGLLVVALVAFAQSDRSEVEVEPPSETQFFAEKFGTLTNISFLAEGGKSVSLADFKGRPVVLNLWATWCAPCVEELPSLDRFQRDFPDIAVVAVSLDKKGEALVREFYAENELSHLALYNDPSMKAMMLLGIPGLPATILIDAKGKEIGGASGAIDWDDPDVRATVKAQLAGASGGSDVEALRTPNPKPPVVDARVLEVAD